jgi:hypothetical protein
MKLIGPIRNIRFS